MKKHRVLIVDDEERIVNFISAKLRARNFDVISANCGARALELIQAQAPDIILLDVIMPKKSGLEVLQELRSFSSVPVIILSAKDMSQDKIKGLELGADDYIAKPFDPDELVARISAALRRSEPLKTSQGASPCTIGDLIIDLSGHKATRKGVLLNLTRIEWMLLGIFIGNQGRLLPYIDLLTRVWGSEYRDDIQLLRTAVSRLRGKLGDRASTKPLIETAPKVGYIFRIP
jgi:two-component system KDP operon response regulator KdpE